MILGIFLVSCKYSEFNGSRTGSDSELVMEYSMFNTTDSQLLTLEKDDVIDVEIVNDSGKLDVVIQEDDKNPVFEGNNLKTSTFQVKVNESGTYKIKPFIKNKKIISVTKKTTKNIKKYG
ncbi:hypothetical protein [Clostridioides sp. ZZV14-6345]|uniref:hypothetical protein n=1 Tax=Clostridioides sp. ZZV14-6345 TaxID=2811496 RepID=UPI001D11707E|nr:hypothetical protein [Clostridioides sp. ZZV14-6345]